MTKLEEKLIEYDTLNSNLNYSSVINLDGIEGIIIEINGKEFKLDKEKIEKFLSNFCKSQNTNRTLLRLEENHKTKKVKYYAIYKKLGFIDGLSELLCFVESEYVAMEICKNDRYSYEEIEKEIEVA